MFKFEFGLKRSKADLHETFWFAALFLALSFSASAQVGTWRSLPTLTEVRDLIATESQILMATDGGILTFSLSDEKFRSGINGRQTRNLDVNSITLDDAGLLWIGSRSPGPILEVIDPVQGLELDVEFVDLDALTSFVQVGDSVYATFHNDLEGGLLLYRRNGSQIEYLDLFSNFPSSASLDLSSADDAHFLNGKIIFRTTRHLLWAEQTGTNLKDPANWHLVDIPSGLAATAKLIPVGNSVLLAADRAIFSYDFSTFSLIHTAGSDVRDLQVSPRDSNLLIYASGDGLFELDVQTSLATPLYSRSSISDIAVTDDAIWMGNSLDFLGRWTAQGYSIFSANRPNNHFFNRLMINGDGDLVAASYHGISILGSQGWHLIRPGTFNSPFNENNYNWDRIILDTLDYNGNAVVEDMITDHSGNLYFAIQGKGILRLDDELPGTSAFFNAENDIMEPTFNSQTYVLTTQMAVDQDNNVWTTTKFIRDGGHVVTIFSESGDIYHIDQDDNGLDTRMAKSIAIDQNGLIWLGSQVETNELLAPGGLQLIENLGIQGGQVEYRASSLIGSPLASNDILQLEVDAQNILWIVTPIGVQSMQLPTTWKTDTELKNWANLYMTTKSSENYYYWQLTDYDVTGMEIDQRGNRWFLSSNAGIHVLLESGRWINGGFGYSTSNSDLLSNEIYAIAFDGTSGEAYISTPKGISVLYTPFANPKANYSSVHIYPQPFNPEIHQQVIIQGLMDNSSVKILTVSGQLVRELNAVNAEVQGFEAHWDGLDQSGGQVGSGVYLLFLYNEDGGASSHKLAVLR